MPAWWQTSVFYQLFPYSFQDSNGDGIGDIAGILRRLDYLSWLGVDALWLGPMYRSPMLDLGYDVADFCDIDPRFGTLADFDRLLAEIHRRGMRAITDFVPNHTSDQHPWFIESRSSRHNPKRDWYVWADGKRDGSPPNNWIDNTLKSAWTRDEATGQFYYHRFLAEQPDLNWRNPEVFAAMADVLRFWLDRGVDGFRMDAAGELFEDALLRDEPVEPEDVQTAGPPGWMYHVLTSERPEGHPTVAALRKVVEAYPDKLFVGEVHAPLGRTLAYYGSSTPEFDLPFNYQLMNTKPWYAANVGAAIDQYMSLLPEGAWPNWVLGNHDQNRLATRVGVNQTRIAAMLQLTLPGTSFIYYGDELGLEDLKLKKHQTVDPYARRGGTGRDPQRAPMPWSDEANAGFTTGKPWLPLPPNYRDCNVAAQQAEPGSMLNFYRQLIALRHAETALQLGDFAPRRGAGEALVFCRRDAERTLQIALNFSDRPQPVQLDGAGEILLTTGLVRQGERVGSCLELAPNEGVVVRLVSP